MVFIVTLESLQQQQELCAVQIKSLTADTEKAREILKSLTRKLDDHIFGKNTSSTTDNTKIRDQVSSQTLVLMRLQTQLNKELKQHSDLTGEITRLELEKKSPDNVVSLPTTPRVGLAA